VYASSKWHRRFSVNSHGVGRVARAAPDGYTLGIGQSGQYVANGAIYPLQYDVLKDFEPVVLLPNVPYWIIAKKAIPANDLKELIVWLKTNPDKGSAGHAGIGGAAHLCGIYFQNRTGTRFQLVPYRGGAPMLQDLVGGQIDFICDLAANSLPMVRSGQIKAYAVMAKTRWFAAPEIPTTDEAEVPGIYVSTWCGLWVPKGTPKEVIAKLNAAAVGAMADPTVRQRTPTKVGRFRRASSRHRRRSAPFKRPRSKNGGRSSRQPASNPNKLSRRQDLKERPDEAFLADTARMMRHANS
jgi:tripartite-type tricarboxylate transporter receptor subunit TctC